MNYRSFAILSLLILLLNITPLAAQETAAFPITIEHKYGTITLTEAPQRIVSIGYNTQDALFALGVQPLAVRYWFGDKNSHGVFPWAEQAANGAQPVLLDMPEGVNYEAILELQPDLIVAVYSGITADEYVLLSQIAPTLAQPAEYADFGIPWQVATQFIGDALGKSAEAEALIAEVEAQFAAVREQYPEFVGKTFIIANYYDGSYGFFTGEDPRSRFFTDLGFVVSDELTAIAGDDFYANISIERVDLLDQDLLVFQSVQYWAGGRAGIESDPILSQMNAMQEGRAVFIPVELDDAFQFQTVLSLSYFLEGIIPELVSAVGSEVAAAPQCEAGFRLFEHAAGETCIPENPQRIVALSDQNALLPLLELGIRPVGSAGRLVDDGSGIFRRTDGFDTTGSEFVGDWTQPNLEAIVALQPDLLVGYEAQLEQYETFSQIAPTVLIQIFDRPLDEALMDFAILADAEEAGEALREAYQAQIGGLIDGLGEHRSDLSVVILNPESASSFYRVYNEGQAIGTVMGALGVAGMTPPENDAIEDAAFSIEFIAEHVGDVVLVIDYSNEQTDPVISDFLESPILNVMPTAQAGQVYRIDGSRTVGSAWVRMQTFIDALEEILLNPDLDTDIVQE